MKYCDKCGHKAMEHPKLECSVADCNCMHLVEISVQYARKEARYWYRLWTKHQVLDDWIKWRKYDSILHSDALSRTSRI